MNDGLREGMDEGRKRGWWFVIYFIRSIYLSITNGLITNAVLAHGSPTRPSTRCRRPRRRLLVKVTAAGTLWVRPEHVGSMATMTTDDILAVYDDAAGLREQTLKVSATSPEVNGHRLYTGSRSKDALSHMH